MLHPNQYKLFQLLFDTGTVSESSMSWLLQCKQTALTTAFWMKQTRRLLRIKLPSSSDWNDKEIHVAICTLSDLCVICNLSLAAAIPDNRYSNKRKKKKKSFPKYKVHVKLHYHITCKNLVIGLRIHNLKLKAFNKIYLLLLLQLPSFAYFTLSTRFCYTATHTSNFLSTTCHYI